jgi:CBS domain-containing protein
LNQRSRKLALRYLSNPASTDWLARFTSVVDSGIVKRVIGIVAPERVEGCWCFCGTTGRGEALPRIAPEIVLLASHERAEGMLQRVVESIKECGYLPVQNQAFEPAYHAASVNVWKRRYQEWLSDPILKEIYKAPPFFDLRPIFGKDAAWDAVETAMRSGINREFLHVVANDCLSTLPPLTFFQNAVLDDAGEEVAVFRLEQTALRPLVDVGRVFGLATGTIFNSSTLERFATAAAALPAHAAIFREAAEALRIVLWQQGRAGISRSDAGSEIPPSMLGPYDRQLLKSAFRSILRLLEFTGDMEWLNTL